MSDNNFCSPLLQRLKNIQTSQERCRNVSNILLSNLRNSSSDESAFQSPPVPLSLNESSERVASSDGSRESIEDVFLEERTSANHLPKGTRMEFSNFAIEKENVAPDQGLLMNKSKFPFLKKGQGLSRFRGKTFKGFKKNNHQPETLKTSLEAVKSSGSQEKTLNNFEKLEQLVNNDSFSSTSSTVMELVQGDASSSLCSTPILSRFSLSATPAFNTGKNTFGTECGFQIQGRTSPARKLFPSAVVLSNSVNKHCMIKYVQNADETDSIARSIEPFPVSSNTPGILKIRNQPTPSPAFQSVSPPSQKVKFLERGVIIEYEDDDDHLNITNYSDDTSYLNVSDMESLARLKSLNLNGIYENLRNVMTSKEQTNFSTMKDDKCISWQGNSLSSSVSHHVNNRVNDKSKSQVNTLNTFEDKNDINVHKMLLLSKANDLVKEIETFKNKNKVMEELIQELKSEKQKLINSQCEPDKVEPETKTKIRSKKPAPNRKKEFVTEIESQLQELTKKLSGLEAENNNLKRKVISLERREKELRKKQNENFQKKNTDTASCKILKRPPFQYAPRGKQKNTCTMDEKRVLQSENIKSDIPVSEKNEDQPLQKESIDKLNDNNNEEEKVIQSGEKRCDEEECVNKIALRETERIELETNVHTRLKDKRASLYTIPEEELFASLHRSSASNETPEELFAPLHRNSASDEIPSRGSPRRGEYSSPLSVKIPPSLPDDSIEIVDVVGRNISLPDESNGVEEILKMNSYPNGDKELIYTHKKVYRYASNSCVQTIFTDREEMIFPNGQREIYYKNGAYQISFPDGSSKSVSKDGEETTFCADGTEIRVGNSGLKTTLFPNGQKEIHESNCIRRIYPDGTIKTLFKDGSQETRYRNGRVRHKDAEGNVSMN